MFVEWMTHTTGPPFIIGSYLGPHCLHPGPLQKTTCIGSREVLQDEFPEQEWGTGAPHSLTVPPLLIEILLTPSNKFPIFLRMIKSEILNLVHIS